MIKKAYRLTRSKKIRTKDKIYDMIWEFHKGDDDFFPSVPHGHSLDGRYKLKIWTGEIYDEKTGRKVGVASRKDIKKLYSNYKFQVFVLEARQAYEERNPRLPQLEGEDDLPALEGWKIRISKKITNTSNPLVFKIRFKEVDL